MRKCTYCGKQYQDEATECVFDGQPLANMIPPSRKPNVNPSKPPHAGGTFAGGVISIVIGIGLVFMMYEAKVQTHTIYPQGWLVGVFAVLFGFYTCVKGVVYAVQSKFFDGSDQQPGSIQKCSYCGRERVDSIAFCIRCGREFKDE